MFARQTIAWPALTYAFLLLTHGQQALAQDTFDCKITLGNNKYDLTALAGEHTVSRERDTPPTRFKDSLTFNLCDDLKRQDGVAEKDQCPTGTRACLTKTNLKDNENDRITAVIQLATPSIDDLEYHALSSPKGISLTFKGSSYPDPVTTQPTTQSFRADILCDTDASGPTFKSYDGKSFAIEWKAPAGCAMGATEPDPDEPPTKTDPPPADPGDESRSVGSGLGYFFLLLILAFAAYFGLGAYYNYSTYGASGMDLIPHRDFWREVPYMLRDVISHLCSAVRPRQSSRGGYIAV